MAEKFVISEDPADIEQGLAPEHYGDPETSCNGEEDPAPDGFAEQAKDVWASARAVFSSYPRRPGSLSKYGSASSRGWGSGWPHCSGRMAAVVGGGVKISVRREVAPIVRLILNYAEDKLGYEIKSGQTGGYNCRPIGGTSVPSNHSWGLAVDINWSSNPMSRTFHCNIPPKLIELFWACGFYWGGWYSGGRYDPMHFEYVGRPGSVAKHLATARRLTGGSAWTPVYTGALGDRVMSAGDRGEDVKYVQERLGILPVDGRFTEDLARAVEAFQKRNDLAIDGEVGPATFKQLKKTQVSITKLARAHDAGGQADKPDTDTKQLQEKLNAKGFDCGTPDGFYGEQTKAAMSAFRAQKYHTHVGHPDTVGAPGAESLLDLGFSVIP